MRTGTRASLARALRECREDTLSLLADLDEARAVVPYRRTINPPVWELGHVGWFQERWCLRRDGRASMLADADRWYDSSAVAHPTRWTLDLPPLAPTRAYLSRVLEASLAALALAPDDDPGLYHHRLALFHELMHQEAFVYTWQNLDYPAPRWRGGRTPCRPSPRDEAAELAFDGGEATLGSVAGAGFVFDNEKWRHPVRVAPFRIDRAPVTNAAFLAFVEDGGYLRREWWDEGYWQQLQSQARRAPLHWHRANGGWTRSWFGDAVALNGAEAVVQVSAFEAQAWCRWAGRRLPTEAEWAFAATCSPALRWGDEVWEWTATPFEPFGGFEPDAYADYSAPWFGTHRVVRGGSFATPRALVDVRFRNFFEPDRNDPFIGFRSCALEA
ncbi:MAG: selenoneine synthase SenA [Lautropia sp.]